MLLIRFKANIMILNHYPINLKDLKINGDDLLNIGFKKNSNLGKTLKTLLFFVINDVNMNKKEILLGKAKEILNKI